MSKLSNLVGCFTVLAAGLSFCLAASFTELTNSDLAHLESSTLRMVSAEDRNNMEQIKYAISNDFSEFKTIQEVQSFLDTVRLLVQKHPKNTAFARDEQKELFKFLSQEIIGRLIRVDADPFIMPISDDKIPLAQKAIDDDELTKKLFGAPLRSFIETKKQQLARSEDGKNVKDGNFFNNFWCKISGSCSHQ